MLKKKTAVIGFAYTCATAFGSFALALLFFKSPDIMARVLFNAGIDILGAFVCMVLFYGCMGQIEHETRFFSTLVVLVSTSFLINELMWFASGTTRWRGLFFVCCLLSKWLNLAMIYCFFLYVRTSLHFQGKLARWADRGFAVLLIVSMLIVLSNVFFPLSFSVNANGVYGKEKLSILEDLYLIVVSVIATVLIVRSRCPRRQKWAAMSFILIPIAEFLASGGAFAYATQYGAVLLSLILMYCIIFNDRSRRLAATKADLTLAAQIQAAMLPSVFPPYPDRKDFEICASMTPAKEVCGDFYAFFFVDDRHLCLLIADVSGKGIPAALFMMASKITLSHLIKSGRSPAQILADANASVCSNNPEEMFVTVWLGLLDLVTGKMICANAGHEYPMLRKPGEPYELIKDKHGFVLGGMDGMKYREYELPMEPGSSLFLYTDGLAEAVNPDNEMFGTERILKTLNTDPTRSPGEILRSMTDAADEYVRGLDPFDDLTMMGFTYHGPSLDPAAAQDA